MTLPDTVIAFYDYLLLHEEMENHAGIKTVHSSKRLDCTQELKDLFAKCVYFYHDEAVKTNRVFVKRRKGCNG